MAAAEEALWGRLCADEEALDRALRAAEAPPPGGGGGGGAAAAAAGAEELLMRAEGALAELRAGGRAAGPEGGRRLEAAASRLASRRASLLSLRDRSTRSGLFGDEAGERRRPKSNAGASQEENDHAALRSLTETYEQFGATLGHMEEVQRRLNETSETIASTQRQYNVFDATLADAAQLLGQLKRRTEEDTKYIWWSFWFFIGVCTYIVLQRLKVFKMIYFGFSWTLWTGSSAVGFGQGLFSQLAIAYQSLCELLGLPNAFESRLE